MRNLAMELRKLCCHPVSSRPPCMFHDPKQQAATTLKILFFAAWLLLGEQQRTTHCASREQRQPLSCSLTLMHPRCVCSQGPAVSINRTDRRGVCDCCRLQFLCDGLEEDMTARWEATRAAAAAEGAAGLQKEVEALTRASGKMLLLHKLLPKLRAEGRQVRPAVPS
jgi:hypothetical protein